MIVLYTHGHPNGSQVTQQQSPQVWAFWRWFQRTYGSHQTDPAKVWVCGRVSRGLLRVFQSWKNKVCNGCIILHLCMCIYIYTPVNKAFLNHKWHIQFDDIYLMRRTSLVIRPDEQKPLLNHDFGGTSPFHLLVGKKNADYWPITFFLFLIILWLVIFSHPQAADPHARAPSSIPWFPNFHLPSHNSTLETLVAGWWFHSALTCSALFEIMIPNSPIFLRRVKTTNYFTGQAGTDWVVCCSDSLQKHLQ